MEPLGKGGWANPTASSLELQNIEYSSQLMHLESESQSQGQLQRWERSRRGLKECPTHEIVTIASWISEAIMQVMPLSMPRGSAWGSEIREHPPVPRLHPSPSEVHLCLHLQHHRIIVKNTLRSLFRFMPLIVTRDSYEYELVSSRRLDKRPIMTGVQTAVPNSVLYRRV